jgi:hypothetical protein
LRAALSELDGFTVSQAEASRWLRENAWAIEEHVFRDLYEFMADTMRLDFPEESLRKIEGEIDSAVTEALDFNAAANRLEVSGYSFKGETLGVVRRFREKGSATAELVLNVTWKGGEPMELGIRISKNADRYTAEPENEAGIESDSSVQ